MFYDAVETDLQSGAQYKYGVRILSFYYVKLQSSHGF